MSLKFTVAAPPPHHHLACQYLDVSGYGQESVVDLLIIAEGVFHAHARNDGQDVGDVVVVRAENQGVVAAIDM